MPNYTFVDTKTNIEWEEYFTSYSAKDLFLSDNPHIKQKLVPLGFIPQNGSSLSKTPASWQEHLRNVKKGAGRNSTVKT